MRSFSLHVGRLFGVEVRIHLAFLILPLFVFWTEYSVHPTASGPRDLALAGNIADHRVGVRQLSLERADTIRRAGQSDHAKSFACETPDNRCAGAGTDACDNGNWLVSHELCFVMA